jgi:hypothetical protein
MRRVEDERGSENHPTARPIGPKIGPKTQNKNNEGPRSGGGRDFFLVPEHDIPGLKV